MLYSILCACRAGGGFEQKNPKYQAMGKRSDKGKGKGEKGSGKGEKGKALQQALDEGRDEAEARRSAADERAALGDEAATGDEREEEIREESEKEHRSPDGKKKTTRSDVAGNMDEGPKDVSNGDNVSTAPLEVWKRRADKREKERDEAREEMASLKRKIEELEAKAAKVKLCFEFCNCSSDFFQSFVHIFMYKCTYFSSVPPHIFFECSSRYLALS